jgi:predicted aspartyl protease
MHDPRTELVTVNMELNGTPVKALIDCGAQGCFVSNSVAARLNPVTKTKLESSVNIRTVTGQLSTCSEYFKDALVTTKDLVSV